MFTIDPNLLAWGLTFIFFASIAIALLNSKGKPRIRYSGSDLKARAEKIIGRPPEE